MGRFIVIVLALGGAITGTLALLDRPSPPQVNAPSASASDPLDQALLTRARDVFRSEAQPVLKDFEERLRTIERLQEEIGRSVAVAESIVEDARLAGGSGGKGLDQEALGPLRGRIEEQRIRLTTLISALDALTERVAAVEARPPEVIREIVREGGAAPSGGSSDRGSSDAPTLPPEDEPDPVATQAEIAQALNDLYGQDVGVVFRAMELVRKHKIFAAVPRLLEILANHKAVFARQAAAATLGALEAADGVVGLLDALVDSENRVGQQAFRSLRDITGIEQELDPTARVAERRRMRGVIQQWWRMHEDEVRARLGQPKKDAE